jgi:tetratricopeptide (TPR) repeat protein
MAAQNSWRGGIETSGSFHCWCRGLKVTLPTASGAVLVCIISSVLAVPPTVSGQGDVDTLLQQARAAEKADDYQEAERVYLQALARAPGNLETFKRLGVLQQTEQKFAASIESFKQVLEHNAQYPEANFFLGVSYFGENDFNRAIHSFERELTTPKPHPRCRYYLALALQAVGRIDETISQLNRAVAENPKDADALYQLARIYKSASLQAIDRLEALDQDSFQLHALMGEVYADNERYAEAIKEYRAALSKRPDAAGIRYAIGVAYWVQHDMDAAKKEFVDALKENPNDALTNLYLGDIAVHQERFAEARNYLNVAERGQPSMPEVHVLLGKCYRGEHEPEKAKTEFLAAIRADPSAAQPHYLLAQLYRELRDPEASAKEFEEFEKLSRLEKEKGFRHGTQKNRPQNNNNDESEN